MLNIKVKRIIQRTAKDKPFSSLEAVQIHVTLNLVGGAAYNLDLLTCCGCVAIWGMEYCSTPRSVMMKKNSNAFVNN